MIKIAYVIDTINTPTAGTEKQLLMLMDDLNRSKFTPYLVCLHDSEWLKTTDLPVEVVTYDVNSVKSLRFVKHIKRFIRFCKQNKIDIIQTFFTDGNKFGVLGGHLAGVPIIIASRRNIGHGYDRKDITMLHFLQRWTTRYLANSQAAVKKTVDLERASAEKIDVIYNGLDLGKIETITPDMRNKQREQWRLTDDETVVGIVANLRSVKNIDSLIRVAAKLVPDFPQLRFVSVGEGPDRTKLQTLIDSTGLKEKFLLAGQHTDIVPCLAAFDLAVLCSRYESFSNSLIEYMAAGLPIVASDIGGNGEAICHGENGLLYPVDDENKLEEALRQLLSNNSLAKQYGDKARQDAFERYSKETCIRNHEKYYERLIQTGGHFDNSFERSTISS